MDAPMIAFPRSICLRVTRRCNAACSFCQAPNTGRAELSVEEIGRIAQHLRSRGVLSLKLSGGEPTVRQDLSTILETVSSAGLKPVVITNGIRMDRELLDSAARADAELKLSIHRPTPTNDEILRVKSFTRVLTNLLALRRAKVKFAINTVLTPDAVDVMDPMASFAHEVGARKISFIPVVPRGRAASGWDGSFSVRELDAIRGHIAELSQTYAGRLTVRCIDIRRHDYWIVENDGSLWIERAREDLDFLVCGKADLLTLSPGQLMLR